MQKLESKPCRSCGSPVKAIRRKTRKAFYYPNRCEGCQYTPSSPEVLATKRRVIAQIRRNFPIGTTRLHDTGGKIYRLIKTGKRKKWDYEHRVIAEQTLGRDLQPGEVVHHINGDTLNNSPENLRVMLAGEHMSLHGQITSWSRKYDQCIQCNTTDRKHLALGFCTRCYQRR